MILFENDVYMTSLYSLLIKSMPIPRRNQIEFFTTNVKELIIPNSEAYIIDTDYYEKYNSDTHHYNSSNYNYNYSNCITVTVSGWYDTNRRNEYGYGFLYKKIICDNPVNEFKKDPKFSNVKKKLLELYSKGSNEDKSNICRQFKEFKIYRHYLGKNANKPIYNICHVKKLYMNQHKNRKTKYLCSLINKKR